MSHTTRIAKSLAWATVAGLDLRILLVMANTTADTEFDRATITALTDLDECDGDGYVRKALVNVSMAAAAGANKVELKADNLVFSNLGTGTRQVVGALVYHQVTDDTDSVPIAYLDGPDFPLDGGGVNLTLLFPSGVVLDSASV